MIFLSIVLAVLAVFTGVIGLIWFIGKGGNIMNWYGSMEPAIKATFDEKAFLRFNGKAMLILAGVLAVSTILVYFGHFWTMWVVVFASFVLGAANIFSLKSKHFRLKDSDGKPIEPEKSDDPKVAKRKKAQLIVAGVVSALVLIVVGWLMIEGSRDVRVNFEQNSMTIRGLYGETINHSEIHSVELLPQSITEFGTGGRRMGHGTQNNLRGRFGAGQLHIQNPDEGPTIRINRINATPIFISLATTEATVTLYNDIQNVLQ